MGLEGKNLLQGEAVGDEALLDQATSRLNDLTLLEGKPLGDGGVGPEGAAAAVSGEMEEEEKRDLLEGKPVEDVAEPMVYPGKMSGDRSYTGRVDRLMIRHRGAHAGEV